MDKNINTLFSELKQDLTNYLTLKLQIFKLDIYEKSSTISSLLLYGLILLLVVFFAFLFLCLSLGFYIGELLGSLSAGMILVAIIYLFTLCILLLLRKKILNWLINIFVEQINQNDDERN